MFKKVINFFKKQNNFRYIAFGFLAVIFIGSGLLMIPGCIKEGVTLNYIDALYTSTSAVCVTGLIVVDVYDTFTIPGQIIVLFLIQVGGLGVTTLGAGLISALRRRITLKERNVIQETLNIDDAKSLLSLFKRVFKYTFIIELVGACLSLIPFLIHRENMFPYPFLGSGPVYDSSVGMAIWRSIFHSVAAFNNSGFDIMGSIGRNELGNFCYSALTNDVFFNLLTAALIILGGLGFLVLSDIRHNFRHPKKFSLHTKVVLLMTSTLIVSGTVLLVITESGRLGSPDAYNGFSVLGAFFASVTARTAGFSTYHFAYFSHAGRMIIIILMFIGASPGSTGGGIKTTTFFVLFVGVKSMITHKKPHAFKYSISEEAVKKALAVCALGMSIVIIGTFAICLIEIGRAQEYTTTDVIFEVASAFGTVGLSTGITPYLSVGSKVISIMIMYIGRIGPLTFMSSWSSGEASVFEYAEGVVPIG